MLQRITLEDLSSAPFRWNVHQQFHPKQGSRNFSCLDLKSNANVTKLICRYSLTASFFRDQSSLLTKRVVLRKWPMILAQLQENDESDKNSWKGYFYYNMLNSATPNPLINQFQSLYDRSGDSNGKPGQSLSCQFSDGQGLSDCSVNIQENLLGRIKAVHLHLMASERWNASQLKLCHRNYLVGAINLTHYLALQCLDIGQLRDDLCSCGLLNLDSISSNILASITACMQFLESLLSKDFSSNEDDCFTHKRDYISVQDTEIMREFTIRAIRRKVASHAVALFGPAQDKRNVHIMVTVGREALLNEMLLTDILKAGASVIRINCAHDDPSVWSEIIRMAKHSSQMLEKPCRILMDLGGSKLRTGCLKMDPNVIRISPKKNAMGEFLPARFWLCCEGSSLPANLLPDAVLCIDQKLLKKLKVGSVLRFVDVRGKKRTVKLLLKSSAFGYSGYLVESLRTVYIGVGTDFYLKNKNTRHSIGRVVKMPMLEPFIRLNVGDLLTICRSSCLSVDGVAPLTFVSSRITCSSDHLFDSVKPGEPIAFDDGKIWGEVRKMSPNEITVLITHADPKGSKLGPGKSINIPKSEMQFKGLTAKDLVDLEFIAANADIVGISFIRDVHDMVIIQHELEKRKLHKLGIVLKIETRNAYENLPLILLQAMQSSNPLGVMIARGDLMVECGWDKMADIQEEILSVCNAAHIPVIWATQVLDSLVKFGLPTRAEITDVTCGMRTSCIMLNKGEHLVEAISALASILSRHAGKNLRTLLRSLSQPACFIE